MKERSKKLRASAVAWGVLILIFAGVIALLSAAGGAVMKIFGFHADSFGSIFLFFLLAGIIGFLGEALAKAFPAVLHEKEPVTDVGAKIIFVTLDTIFSMLSFLRRDAALGAEEASGPTD